jgi:hypothetical protein
MVINLQRIENPQMMEVYVNGPRNANRLFIFGGTAVFNWHRTDESWAGDVMFIPMTTIPGRPVIPPDRWVDAVAVASLASIHFRETIRRDRVGFAVNSVRPSPPSGDFHEEYGINVSLALIGNDVRLYRVSFQLTVLARI